MCKEPARRYVRCAHSIQTYEDSGLSAAANSLTQEPQPLWLSGGPCRRCAVRRGPDGDDVRGTAESGPTFANGLDSPVIFDGFPELASLDTTDTASARPVFRHSVIPGGVYTPAELKNALARDAVAASHYPSLQPEAVRAAVVTQDRFAYVSYRKDDRIYWTRNKVRLSAGETILTDGANEIRARCGNCISDTAMLPVADVEPDAAELDRLVRG